MGSARVEAAVAMLRRRGARVTEARRGVLDALDEAGGHLSADDLAALLGRSAPHRATVYRTLESLVQAGVVAHVHLPHGATTYHLVDAGDRTHLHLACRGCGTVLDARPDLLDPVAAELRGTVGFELDPAHVALTGWCESCR
jgi:Fur family ferric uptake transcriptional regulator